MHKWHTQNVCIRLVKGLHGPYQSLSSASISNRTINFAGEYHWNTYQTGKSLKWADRLSSDFLSFCVSQAYTIAAEALYYDSNAKKQHKSQGIALIVLKEFRLVSNSQVTPRLCLPLLFVGTKPPMPRSSTEHVCASIAYCDNWHSTWRLQQPRSGGIVQNIERKYV